MAFNIVITRNVRQPVARPVGPQPEPTPLHPRNPNPTPTPIQHPTASNSITAALNYRRTL